MYGGRTETGIDDEDFATFWEHERDRLYRALALSLGDAQLAAEAVDEAMVRALERWAVVGRYERPAAWVYRVAMNWATSWRRKWSRRPVRPEQELDRPSDDRFPDVDVARALASLRPQHRQAVVLRYYLQMTPGEIAVALGIPAGTAKSHVHRGVEHLRERTEVARD